MIKSKILVFRFTPGSENYTQIAWADTEELGCGMVHYRGDTKYETIFVCNYAKSGNQLGTFAFSLNIVLRD